MRSAVLPPSRSSAEAEREIRSTTPLRRGLMVSGFVHVGLALLFLYWGTRPAPQRPPIYKVDLVGAPAGPRQIGVVDQTPTPPAVTEAPAPSGAEHATPPVKTPPTTKKSVKAAPPPKKATPIPNRSKTAGAKKPTTNAKAAAPPKAGSGEKGDKGQDVATVRTAGIAFPNQGYLNNITRQVYLNWFPRNRSTAIVAELKFVIHRNGSVDNIEVVKSSGDRLYDAEATAAIEAVANARLFGPLPREWADDVLIVYFTFDYAQR